MTTRACSKCTLICEDANRHACELCGASLPSGGAASRSCGLKVVRSSPFKTRREHVRKPFKKKTVRPPHQGEQELRDGWEDDYYEYAEDEYVHAPPNPRDNPEYYIWTCCGQPCDEAGDECPEATDYNEATSDESDF